MKQPEYIEEVVPKRATSEELKAMALRQQQQIDTQQQLLVAKEQRLRFLKLQEAKGIEAAEEAERLRRLREKVDAQESKLKRLRALRGQVDLQKTYNVTLSNDLDSIRALFSEKEKELSLAVAKVDVLTKQLEELRRDRRGPLGLIQPVNSIAASKELENLRRELMYRNQLSLQQDAKLHLQREALQQRQAELHSVDQRILELQERLSRRKSSNILLQRISNDQNDNALLFYNNTNNNVVQLNKTHNMKYAYPQKRGNIVAVEPYNHIPTKLLHKQESVNTINDTSHMNKINFENDFFDLKKNVQGNLNYTKSAHRILQNDINGSESNCNTDNLKFYSKPFSLEEQLNINESIKNDTPMQDNKLKSNDDPGLNNSEGLKISKINMDTHSSSSPPSQVLDQENKSSDNNEKEEKFQFKHKNMHFIPSGNLLTPPRKPIGSFAASSNLASNFSGTNPKIHVVSPSVLLISQLSNTENEKSRPALPPKPIKGSATNYVDDSKKELSNNNMNTSNVTSIDSQPIKAKPLTIKKQPVTEQPKLKSSFNKQSNFQQNDGQKQSQTSINNTELPCVMDDVLQYDSDEVDKSSTAKSSEVIEKTDGTRRKRALANENLKVKLARRVSFDPLALLLDASLEGELELIKKTAVQVPNPSAANDEGITALHNAICAGHFEIVKFLVNFGCDVNAQDSDGWTPLHCAASCNNLPMVKFLVESGACLFASTLSDHETPAEKCEEDEEGFDGCSEYLYNMQEKLGIMNNGEAYAVFSFDAMNPDELSFSINDKLNILRKGDEAEREWWWAKDSLGREGYVPRNLLGLHPRIKVQEKD